MTEPVFIALSFRNDGETEQLPACISQYPNSTERGGVYQHLTPSELTKFGDNLTLCWEAEFDGEGYDLIRPITRREADAMVPYRCDLTDDMFEEGEVPF